MGRHRLRSLADNGAKARQLLSDDRRRQGVRQGIMAHRLDVLPHEDRDPAGLAEQLVALLEDAPPPDRNRSIRRASESGISMPAT